MVKDLLSPIPVSSNSDGWQPHSAEFSMFVAESFNTATEPWNHGNWIREIIPKWPNNSG